MQVLASQQPVEAIFPIVSAIMHQQSCYGWWLHEFKLATVQHIRPKMAAELERQAAEPSWLGMYCKKPRREELLETSSANSGTWIKTLAHGELCQWGWSARPGSLQSFQTWQRSIDGWTKCLGSCCQLGAHCHHKSTQKKINCRWPLRSLSFLSFILKRVLWHLAQQKSPVNNWLKCRGKDQQKHVLLPWPPRVRKGIRLMAMGTVPCLLWKWWTWWVVLREEETRAATAGAGEHQQCQREHKPEQEGRTGPNHSWCCRWPWYQ